MEITLGLTHRCNLSCTYCYSGRAVKQDMALATAQKIVDFAVDITPPEQRIEFGFFGGEPLLCFGLVQEITRYIREKQGERPVRLSITTNGTLLTQSVFDFLKEERIDLCLSIDGPAHVHDLHRRYRNGRGSFADVARNLQEALERLDYVQVNAVYGPETIDSLPETVSSFTQLGVQVMHLNPDICASWTEDTYPKLRKAYTQIADQYIESYQRGQEIAINLIDSKNILFLKGGYSAGDMCGMGETEWGFAPSGNIYPCERFIGEDNDPALCLGNIHTGLDLTLRCSLLKRRGNSNRECEDCEFKDYCMNWCGCTNHYMTGHTDLAGPMLCASEKEVIRAAKRVFVTLSQTDNELFVDHLMNYLHGGHHCQQA